MYNATLINEEIEKQGLTNEKLAVKADLTARTISKIRKGDPHIQLPSLTVVAEALGLKVEIHLSKKIANGRSVEVMAS
jgi:transcriptional regulator with XRE-family HTH domain